MIHEIFVPGRLCILGEHSDWGGSYRKSNPFVGCGLTVVCSTNEGLFARCEQTQSNSIIFSHEAQNHDIQSSELPFDLRILTDIASKGVFISYVAGTTAAILEYTSVSRPDLFSAISTSGIKIDNYKTTLPMKKGLSSSAAICVLIIQCFNEVFDCSFSRELIMELAYQGEMKTPSKCGRMDQCVAMGSGSIGMMIFDEEKCELFPLKSPIPLYFVVGDLNASKDTVKILSSLNECFPFPQNKQQSLLHLYMLMNLEVGWGAIEAIETGDLSSLSQAILTSQSNFDLSAIPLCPSQLSSPRLHHLLHTFLPSSPTSSPFSLPFIPFIIS